MLFDTLQLHPDAILLSAATAGMTQMTKGEHLRSDLEMRRP